MVGPPSLVCVLAVVASLPLVGLVGFVVYVCCSAIVRSSSGSSRRQPVFLPLRVPPDESGEAVAFPTDDGLNWPGATSRRGRRRGPGVLVYCHEFLGRPLELRALRRRPPRRGLRPLHLRLPQPRRQRPPSRLPAAPVGDRPRGPRPRGGAGLPADAARPRPGRLRAVRRQPGRRHGAAASRPTTPTSGASSPTARSRPEGRCTAYILRWAEIYVATRLDSGGPCRAASIRFLGWVGRHAVAAASSTCVFPNVERAVARLAPASLAA